MQLKYSLKSFFLLLIIVTLFFSFWSFFDRGRKLEESLIKFVVQEKLGSVQDFGSSDLYLAKGTPSNFVWLDSDFTKDIGLTEIVSGQPNPDSDIFYVGEIHWIDSNTVSLNYGIVYWDLHHHYFEGAKFQLAKGNWSCIDDGIGYAEDTR